MLKRLIVGKLQSNCYLLEINEKIIIIDPGSDFELIKENIKKEVSFVLVTHHHDDHVGALEEVKDYYNVRVYDINNLKEGINIINNVKFKCVHTKGHTNDSISFMFNDIMFSGDFIFRGSIGRYDFEDLSSLDMKNSIDKILKYNQDIKIYPGHGPSTYLKDEIDNLNYFRRIL